MEKIFWLMWLADIVGSIGVVAVVSLVSAAIASVFLLIGCSIIDDMEPMTKLWKSARWLLIPVAIGTVTPSQKTIYVLAAASAAEVAATTALGAKALQAANAVLDSVIDKSKAK